jgi:hypothetical protein
MDNLPGMIRDLTAEGHKMSNIIRHLEKVYPSEKVNKAVLKYEAGLKSLGKDRGWTA